MRPQPYTPAPAPPPQVLFHSSSTYLQNEHPASDRHLRRSRSLDFNADYDDDISSSSSSGGDFGTPHGDLEPDTTRLLQPPPRCKHRLPHQSVRIQGQLANVRSVSTASLQRVTSALSSSGLPSPYTRSDTGVGVGSYSSDFGSNVGTARTQRSQSSTARKADRRSRRSLATDHGRNHDVMARERDTQLRAYGIGGAGNIRRVTDVIGTSTRPSSSFNSLFSRSSSAPNSPRTTQHTSDWRRWNLGDYFSRLNNRKGKSKASKINI
ncbi:hypothetical protein PG989_014790 [Apiospora arundinis]